MSTTNILDLNNRIDKLADDVTSVENALTNVTSGTFTGLLGFTFTWVKYGKIVYFRVSNDATKIPQGDTIIGDIPDNILPMIHTTFDCTRSFDNKCSFIISPSTKKITVHCGIPTGSSSPYYVQGNVIYM